MTIEMARSSPRAVAFWNRVSRDYRISLDEIERIVDAALSPADLVNARILDAGCGNGMFSVVLARKGARSVVGVDFSQASLLAARELATECGCRNVQFVAGDIQQMQFQPQAFDIVFAWGSVYYAADPDRALDALTAVLRCGGAMIVALQRRTPRTLALSWLAAVLGRLPARSHRPAATILACLAAPFARLAFSRDGVRRLQQKILLWCFIPGRTHMFTDAALKAAGRMRNLHVSMVVMQPSTRFNAATMLAARLEKPQA